MYALILKFISLETNETKDWQNQVLAKHTSGEKARDAPPTQEPSKREKGVGSGGPAPAPRLVDNRPSKFGPCWS